MVQTARITCRPVIPLGIVPEWESVDGGRWLLYGTVRKGWDWRLERVTLLLGFQPFLVM